MFPEGGPYWAGRGQDFHSAVQICLDDGPELQDG